MFDCNTSSTAVLVRKDVVYKPEILGETSFILNGTFKNEVIVIQFPLRTNTMTRIANHRRALDDANCIEMQGVIGNESADAMIIEMLFGDGIFARDGSTSDLDGITNGRLQLENMKDDDYVVTMDSDTAQEGDGFSLTLQLCPKEQIIESQWASTFAEQTKEPRNWIIAILVFCILSTCIGKLLISFQKDWSRIWKKKNRLRVKSHSQILLVKPIVPST